MSTTVSYITRRGGRRVVETTREVKPDRLIAGRGADCDIQLSDLSVRLVHARLSWVRPGRLLIEGLGGGRFVVSGRTMGRGELDVSAGVNIEIGPHILTISADGGDVSIEIEDTKRGQARGSSESDESFSLRSSWLSKRAASWVLAVLTLLTGLALPVVSYSTRPSSASEVTALMRDGEGNDVPAEAPADTPIKSGLDVSGRLWSAGHLSTAHRALTGDCKACHVAPFVSVRDETCLSCHDTLRHHGDPSELALSSPSPSPGRALLQQVSTAFGRPVDRCASCHSEHNPTADLAGARQEDCASCHREPTRGGLGAATDFGRHHPEFHPTISAGHTDTGEPMSVRRLSIDSLAREADARRKAMNKATGSPDCDGFNPGQANFRGVEHTSVSAASSGDRSGLVFPHKLHLDANGCVAGLIKRLGDAARYSDALTCADCHVPDEGGALFEPVRMEDACSDCHSLVFERVEGVDRVLRHGEPIEVIAAMRDFYRAQTVAGVLRAQEDARNRPGPAGLRPGAMREAAFASAGDRAQRRIEAIFSPGGACYGCHAVSLPDGGRVEDIIIDKVSLQDSFFPKAKFSHAAHEGATCTSCHAALTSESSEDVLLPSIETCRSCHAGEHTEIRTPSTCVSCHDFHSETVDRPLMIRSSVPGAFFR